MDDSVGFGTGDSFALGASFGAVDCLSMLAQVLAVPSGIALGLAVEVAEAETAAVGSGAAGAGSESPHPVVLS